MSGKHGPGIGQDPFCEKLLSEGLACSLRVRCGTPLERMPEREALRPVASHSRGSRGETDCPNKHHRRQRRPAAVDAEEAQKRFPRINVPSTSNARDDDPVAMCGVVAVDDHVGGQPSTRYPFACIPAWARFSNLQDGSAEVQVHPRIVTLVPDTSSVERKDHMERIQKRWAAMGLAAGLLLGGGALANAATRTQATTPTVPAPAVTVKSAATPTPPASVTSTADPAMPTDAVDPADTPDLNEAPGTETADANEAPGTETADANEAADSGVDCENGIVKGTSMQCDGGPSANQDNSTEAPETAAQ